MNRLTLVIAAAGLGSALTLSGAMADCQSDATAARGALEEAGKALGAATKRKADPQTLCPLFRSYVTAEIRWNKFLVDNKEWCQVPDEAIKASSASLKKSSGVRDQVCQAAASGVAPGGPAKPPPQGSISSALGVTTGYSLGGAGGNVFDTLNGNVMKK
ncbi:hypothetical protein [Xanthobacter tagetidis]|jgi:hypothetical protein|uniref:Uncharacterized protein n=1 Tax=Xanthobacter tagetidis TaxID=60216 RepID=A0A3L7A8V8_9HYPH|nr:hypothetical protein [Xanthobacter tagetidis]MBB6307264.1 hypothetical protein [Xanthobacter tagetidis]RLP75812.1 hypothetical protein D9R14_16085 [Xanthobacter tagetidis]